MINKILDDIDPIETEEWLQAIKNILSKDGKNRIIFLINTIVQFLNNKGYKNLLNYKSLDFLNTIPVNKESIYPGNLIIERKICAFVRWNAVMLVLRASKKNKDLGGHLSSFQSSSIIYEVAFNHFFRASNNLDGGDFIYFQGHISPGIYSRAFLEGRLTETELDSFRQESSGKGLSSYPHPKLMPNFWQFPTVSMGLSAISAIYQARFLKYLLHRKLKDTSRQKVYAFLGDGEMDEPESKGAITIASREKLDNLIFVINCNLQRLDGPVYGNGNIIKELENFFLGAGWYVIKVIWGSKWDKLLKRNGSEMLKKLMYETLDGDYQTLRSKNGQYIRKNFFNKYFETKKLVQNMTDEEIWELNHGGHDEKKIYSAFALALQVKEKPVVILMHTIKGYGLNTEGKNNAHQIKNMSIKDLKNFAKHLNLSKKNINFEMLPYLKFDNNSKEYQYLHDQRKKLCGYLPNRRSKFSDKLCLPTLENFKILLKKSLKPFSTTMFFVRILNFLLDFKDIGKKIVPIVADEARTFGMEGLFRKIGIYNSQGQKYIPADKEQLFYYRESKMGQIIQEGINELGAGSSWIAAATSYSSNNYPMIPFYIFYSMFGFQRIGDLLWSAGDQQARGFLIGATSGRTTLNGEGLQHSDGHSHIYSLTFPNCISYDPAYHYELLVIIQNGLKRMYGKNQENIFYYITTMNENYYMPNIEITSQIKKGICKGIYLLESYNGKNGKVQLLGSGSLLRILKNSANILKSEYDIGSDIYSVTSFTELARNGQDCARWNFLNFHLTPKISYVSKILKNLPTIAVTDYMKIFAEQIRSYIPSPYFHVLGTDGFGRSDSRRKLRNFFEISEGYIISSVIYLLIQQGKKLSSQILLKAFKDFNISIDKMNPRLS
ncbi:pyruvate dehydrogenase (acetyl-transferring), homodimeric type [Buchnera aphidicola]|uniref:Pyruvate dehydrogenase E1 component n=1 Tax=Buchnera aphidicola subsp. Tuberolachnus salignus TaxID=98804 RepID=A0A160SYN1_BUCTT|nr:pyruvate dehydrogenase (acetyl-transferring), homodimeric type [Buchnera aphidicola]CUR53121.1 Pyruvate dehydrogenase E1 component [Buchnera aphidicola (Tuberolachnus salignus)]